MSRGQQLQIGLTVLQQTVLCVIYKSSFQGTQCIIIIMYLLGILKIILKNAWQLLFVPYLKACSWCWNEWLLPLFTTHGKHIHVVEPRWSKVFQNLCVQVYNIISFIAVTAEKIQTAMLHCKRFCNPYQDQKINYLAYLLDFAPLQVFTCISLKLTKP